MRQQGGLTYFIFGRNFSCTRVPHAGDDPSLPNYREVAEDDGYGRSARIYCGLGSLERILRQFPRSRVARETCLIGYVNDFASLIAARDVVQAQLKLNRVVRTVNS